MRLRNKAAMVTGAAMGIGAATATLFAGEGASVVVLDKNPSGEAVARQIEKSGGRALFVRADISSEEQIREAMARTESVFGRLDILVNNAAEFVMKGLEARPQDWHRVVDVNIVGTSLCTRFAAEMMKKNGGGAIVNLSSISGLIAEPGHLTYSATKAALIQMTRSIALDLARYGIRVNCVCPGYIRTAATDQYLALAGITQKEYAARYGPLHLLNRVGEPHEVAYAILFLASDEASFITGTSLVVDGGYVVR